MTNAKVRHVTPFGSFITEGMLPVTILDGEENFRRAAAAAALQECVGRLSVDVFSIEGRCRRDTKCLRLTFKGAFYQCHYSSVGILKTYSASKAHSERLYHYRNMQSPSPGYSEAAHEEGIPATI